MQHAFHGRGEWLQYALSGAAGCPGADRQKQVHGPDRRFAREVVEQLIALHGASLARRAGVSLI